MATEHAPGSRSSAPPPRRKRRRSPWVRLATVFFATIALAIILLEVTRLDGLLDQIPYGLLVLGAGLWVLSFLVVLVDTVLRLIDRKVGVRRPPVA